jgi:hypothetical protein
MKTSPNIKDRSIRHIDSVTKNNDVASFLSFWDILEQAEYSMINDILSRYQTIDVDTVTLQTNETSRLAHHAGSDNRRPVLHNHWSLIRLEANSATFWHVDLRVA